MTYSTLSSTAVALVPALPIAGGITVGASVGETVGKPGINKKASIIAGGATLLASSINGNIISHVNAETIKAETITTEAYVESLTDEELEQALIQIGELEAAQDENIKCL